MDLREILDWDAVPELADVLDHLELDVNFWKDKEPTELQVDAIQKELRDFANTYLADYDTLLEGFRRGESHIVELVARSFAETLRNAIKIDPDEFDGDVTGEPWKELLKLWGSASHTRWLVLDADELAGAGHVDQALDLYRLTLDECPRPKIHAELGRILADRAGLVSRLTWRTGYSNDPPILSSIDFREQAEVLDEDLLHHPIASHSPELLRLALQGYGRAYLAQVRQATDAELTRLEAESLYFDHCLVLDGLRAIFLEMNRLREAGIVCRVFEVWSLLIAEQGGEVAGPQFQQRFSQTLGMLEGRRIEATIQQAVLETRHAVVIHDRDAFADYLLGRLSESVPKVPDRTRAEIQDELGALLGPEWKLLPDPSRQSLTEAEWLRQLLDNANGNDYGAVVIGYGKALEGLLRQLDASKDNLSQFRQRFKKFREQRIRFLRVGSINDELLSMLTQLVDLRDRAAHGDDEAPQTISRGEMRESRRALLGEDAYLGLLTRLLKARQA